MIYKLKHVDTNCNKKNILLTMLCIRVHAVFVLNSQATSAC